MVDALIHLRLLARWRLIPPHSGKLLRRFELVHIVFEDAAATIVSGFTPPIKQHYVVEYSASHQFVQQGLVLVQI